MIPRMDPMTIGPEHGDLTLHTGVEGRAAKAGHNLTIRMADWSGTASFDGDEPSSLSFRTALSSLEVVSGEGGVKALSDKDKRTIKDSALESLSAKRHPEITFESSKVSPRSGGYDVDGELSIAGVTQPCTLDLSVQRTGGNASVDASVPVLQTAFGVKPYSAMMGGLKVKDQVEVRLSLSVPDPA